MQNWRKNSQIFAIYWDRAIPVEYIWLHFILNCTCFYATKIMNHQKRFCMKLKMNFLMKERVFGGLSAGIPVTADVMGSSSDSNAVRRALIKAARHVYQKKLE